jgi:hypothetical protein
LRRVKNLENTVYHDAVIEAGTIVQEGTVGGRVAVITCDGVLHHLDVEALRG